MLQGLQAVTSSPQDITYTIRPLSFRPSVSQGEPWPQLLAFLLVPPTRPRGSQASCDWSVGETEAEPATLTGHQLTLTKQNVVDKF